MTVRPARPRAEWPGRRDLLHVVDEQGDRLALEAAGDLADGGDVGVRARSGDEDEAVGVGRERRWASSRSGSESSASRNVMAPAATSRRRAWSSSLAGGRAGSAPSDLAELARQQPRQQGDVVVLVAEVDGDDAAAGPSRAPTGGRRSSCRRRACRRAARPRPGGFRRRAPRRGGRTRWAARLLDVVECAGAGRRARPAPSGPAGAAWTRSETVLDIVSRPGLHDVDPGRAEHDDEQARQDEQHHREQDLDGELHRLLLGVLAPFEAQLGGLDLQRLGDRHAELLGLGEGADHLAQLGHTDPLRQRRERRGAGDAGACVLHDPGELGGQRTLGCPGHRAMAASRPRPARTEITIWSTVSASDRRMTCWRSSALCLRRRSGPKKPNRVNPAATTTIIRLGEPVSWRTPSAAPAPPSRILAASTRSVVQPRGVPASSSRCSRASTRPWGVYFRAQRPRRSSSGWSGAGADAVLQGRRPQVVAGGIDAAEVEGGSCVAGARQRPPQGKQCADDGDGTEHD